MTFEIKYPSDIYQRINDELENLIQLLPSQTNEEALSEAESEALNQLKQYQGLLHERLVKLEKNAEWNTFTIAFYGETGAGKSSIIETLRILLGEPSKLASQQVFRELKDKYGLSEENLQQLAQDTELASKKVTEITRQLNSTEQEHERKHKGALSYIEKLQFFLAEHKRTASLWQKLLNWFRKMPEEIELVKYEQLLLAMVAAQDDAISPLRRQKAEAEQRKYELIQRTKELEKHLSELDMLADGSIIGDGSSDFTRKSQKYNFELNGQKFALLDVPGIEGKEGLVLEEIERAVQTAHAVFYVTNHAAPPQTGDEQRKGTLEKIKTHLSAQTEVWTIFNKKIINPLALKSHPLIKDDEEESLDVLNEKMREHLGNHYREIFPLTALSAFLISTNHFSPGSQNAKRRSKILGSFDADELLEKTRMRAFIRMLSEQLLSDSEAKIKAANFNQAKNKVDEINARIQHIQLTFSELAEKLELDGNSSCKQLRQSFNILKQNLESHSNKLIVELESSVRGSLYKLIQQDIGNDTFKSELLRLVEQQQTRLDEKLRVAISTEVEKFQQDAQEILKRFEEHSKEINNIYGKIGSVSVNVDFDFKVNIDNGANALHLLSGLIGVVFAALTGGASLWVTGTALLTSLVSFGKALQSSFSSSYKKSQQRKATDDNLRRISEQLLGALRDALNESMPKMQETIKLLEQALRAPGEQAAANVQLLTFSAQKLHLLSRQINYAGNLK